MAGDNLFSDSTLAISQPKGEILINRILQMDADASTRLESLADKLLAVKIRGLPEFFLLPEEGRLRLLWKTERRPDATIRGALPSVIKAMSSSANGSFQPEGGWEVVSDPDTTRLVAAFLTSFQPDWEELLSKFVGDTLARKVGRLLQTISGWAQDSGDAVAHNVAEYLQQERPVLATRLRLEHFLSEVQYLQQKTGGLELRLQAFDRQTGKN